MTIEELLNRIHDYQQKLKLPDAYLFNIVEFTPTEIDSYQSKQAALDVYQAVLRQITRLYLLSLSPRALLQKLRDFQQSASLPQHDWLAIMNVNPDSQAAFLAGQMPTMVYVTALNTLQSKYPAQ